MESPSQLDNESRWQLVKGWILRFCDTTNQRELEAAGRDLGDDPSIDTTDKAALRPLFKWLQRNTGHA